VAESPVRAAGGVVWRKPVDGDVEILLVHRPKYGDWTLPKGKAEPDETDEDCALREVHEETGLRCRLGPELPSTSYRDRFDRPKVVRYWAMEPLEGHFEPSDEVDSVEWLRREEVTGRLTYERDRPVVAALAAR
jgi:8-oxo-dGTP pyrophosphatase MutT (NUDIX family)